MKRFKEFLLEEGPFLDAVCHGVKIGYEAFKRKRLEQKPPESLAEKILSSEGEEVKQVAKELVDSGYKAKKGKITKTPKVKRSTDWLLECINTKTA